jgi:CelD/BcsL family acetyltransferase involved in cellulose biosynthesis
MYAQIYHGDAIFTELAPEWDALARRGMTDTPFQSLAYQQAWWQNLQPPDSELASVITRDDAGRLTAIACLYITDQGVVHFNGCVEETDYLDLIAEARHAQDAWSAVFNCLESEAYPPWRSLELCNIPAISPSRAVLPRLAQGFDFLLVESIDEVCPVIQLPGTFDAYLESLDSKQRREVQRKLRRARGAEANLQIIGPESDLRQAVDDFLDLLGGSTFEKRDWLHENRRSLFHAVAAAAQEAGTLQLMFMVVDGRKAAGLFNFDYADRIWVYNSGLDPTAFGSLSLGVVLTANAIQWAIENGRSEFDFLRGSETYKYRFGAQDSTIYRLQISRGQH